VLSTLQAPDIYTRSSAGFVARVHAVGENWAAATPLPGWNVRDLVNHLVNEERWTPELLSGATIAEIGDRFEGDLLGDDPTAACDRAAAAALAAIGATGAMERVVQLSFGEQAGHEYTMQLAADHLVHTWDLARAVGADETLDPDAVAAVLEWFDATEMLYREAGLIGARVEVGPGAGPQEMLLARFGRKP
jgi:uncharacterized protein (TIGR03086 family)